MTSAKLYAASVGVVIMFLVVASVYIISDLTSLAVTFSDLDFEAQAMGERPIDDSPLFGYLFLFLFAGLAVGTALLGITAYRNLRYALTGARDGSHDESSTTSPDSQSN